jgi:hypothetical protein
VRNQSERQMAGLPGGFAVFNKRVYASRPAPVPQSVGKGKYKETMPIYDHLCKTPSQPLRAPWSAEPTDVTDVRDAVRVAVANGCSPHPKQLLHEQHVGR